MKTLGLSMWKNSYLFSVVTLALISGCASREIQIVTAPAGADVALARNDQSEVPLGKTPLTIDDKTHPEVFGDGALLQISKQSYLSASLVVPQSTLAQHSRLQVQLKENALPESCRGNSEKVNRLARGIAATQSLIKRKDYVQAESVLHELSDLFPDVSVIYDLLGNLYYLHRDVAHALASYKKSNDLSPNNPETVRMIQKLGALRGEGTPDNSSGGPR